MKYMTLIRGDAEVTYPIYEMANIPNTTLRLTEYETSDGIKALAHVFTSGNLPAGVQSVFTDDLPTSPDSYGSIMQTKMLFELDTASRLFYCPEAHFLTVPIGERPTDWDTNFFDYYEYQTGQVGNWGNVPAPVYPATDPRQVPDWSATAQYYKNNTDDIRQRFNHLFFTKSNYSFGIWAMCGQGEGEAAYRHYSLSASNPRSILYNAQDSYMWRDTNGVQLSTDGLTPDQRSAVWRASMAFLYPADYPTSPTFDEIPLTQPRRDMYIFCCCEYNGIMYYGIAGIVHDNVSNWVVGRTILFTRDFWGDSVSDTPPEPEPQGGEWGESTQRAGGQGLHAANSDSRGDRAGTTVRDIMSSRDSALALAFDTPFMRTYSFDNLSRSQIAEIFAILYGTDYWSLFQNQMLNPLSSIVAFHLIPSTLRGANLTLEDLIIGPKNISAAMTGTPQVTKIKQVKWYHVGTVDISNVLLPYFDAFPDFAPYTDIILHLPYIGDIKIDVNAVMYGALSVEYACDNVSGNVAAWIYCEDRYPEPLKHKQYKYIATGNCAYNIPLFAQSQNGLDVGKIIGSGVGIVGGLATGNVAAAVSGAMGVGSALYEQSRAPISTQSTGGSSGNVSILGDSDVWIEVIRQQWINPENYQTQSGIPSQISGKISDFRGGFFQVETVDLENVPATDSEIAELEQMLKDGIYYNFE